MNPEFVPEPPPGRAPILSIPDLDLTVRAEDAESLVARACEALGADDGTATKAFLADRAYMETGEAIDADLPDEAFLRQLDSTGWAKLTGLD